MSGKSSIEWTEHTWNPITGCSKISPGCENCYAEKLSHRFGWTEKPWTAAYAAENVKLYPDRLDIPLKWKKPRMIFVNSMSDLFHEHVSHDFLRKVWEVMVGSPHHIFQVLTKRPERMQEWVSKHGVQIAGGRPAKNVWLGVTVEDQRRADERIPFLLQTPAAVRFLSCEPLLEPVNLERHLNGGKTSEEWRARALSGVDPYGFRPPYPRIHWVIAGGESGPNARPIHPDWVRDIRDQCQKAGVPFFFKQWGEWFVPEDGAEACRVCGCTWHNACEGGCFWIEPGLCSNCVGKPVPDYRAVKFQRIGKKKAGRMLDGRTWDEMPKTEGVSDHADIR